MSDEDESVSEGFSASEDEWTPNKTQTRHNGESSDDDDSDFEDSPGLNTGGGAKGRPTSRKRETVKSQQRNRMEGGGVAKKRKPMGQSLRAKLYNKYRPPPKTFPNSNSGNNSPSASTSRTTASKNEVTPNEVGYIDDNDDNDNDDGSSSDSSVGAHLVNPADLDLRSSFFNVENATKKVSKLAEQPTTAPVFDCNAGVEQHSEDDDDDDHNENSNKAFDFRHLLEKANSLERVKEQIAKRNAKSTKKNNSNNAANTKSSKSKANALDDVTTLLALGENQNFRHDMGAEEDDEDDDDDEDGGGKNAKRAPSKLCKTKSTRIKKHTKTRPSSQVLLSGAGGGADTDDSDFEEVAGDGDDQQPLGDDDNLQIIVDPTIRKRTKEEKTQHELEMAFKRRLNRDLKEKQLLLHKTSLLYLFGRSYNYNRLLNDSNLMKSALKLLPGAKAYPRETGTELKYFQSFVTWFKTVVKLGSQNMYPDDDKVGKTWAEIKQQLIEQIEKKEARCKQDFIFIFIALLRGMGLQCRLVVNMQPLPIKPAQQDLLSLKLKPDNKNEKKNTKAGGKNTNAKTATSKDNSPNAKSKSDSSKSRKVEKAVERTGEKNMASLGQKLSRNETKPAAAARVLRSRQNSTAKEPPSDKATTLEIPQSNSIDENTSTKEPSEDNLPNTKIKSGSRKRKAEKTVESTGEKNKATLAQKLSRNEIKTTVEETGEKKIAEKGNAKAKKKERTQTTTTAAPVAARVLRSRSTNTTAKELTKGKATNLKIPQLDGVDDELEMAAAAHHRSRKRPPPPPLSSPKKPKSKKQQNNDDDNERGGNDSDEDFEPSPPKQIKRAPVLPKPLERLRKDRRILSTDNETDAAAASSSKSNAKKAEVTDMWVEVWSDVENEWICADIFKGKLRSVEWIRKSTSSNLAYVYAFQNDLSLKDVTARYCPHWAATVKKHRVDRAWLETAIAPYYGQRTDRDIREDHEMRRIHEEKPLPTSISDFKDHPLYVLERHLLKFQAIYPPNPMTIGYTKTKEPIYARDCVHTLHSREIWLKSARTVKLGEQPYKIVKARPKWDRLTQSVIKDQPLEIFGFWQTQDYEPPTAENGIVPRNAYGNVELFKACMLPKKCVHLRLNGLNRICKKLNIDCANAVVGFDFHQGACHPTYDGFVICEEFQDQVTAAWYQDQEDQDRKEQEKYEARVYGNWKKLIKGLLIRERIKRKYNF